MSVRLVLPIVSRHFRLHCQLPSSAFSLLPNSACIHSLATTSSKTQRRIPSIQSSRPPLRLTASDRNSTSYESDNHLDLTESAVQKRVLETALNYVSQYGWSAKAVEAAAVAEGLPPGLHTLACPQGAIDIVLYFYTSRNQQLAEAMVEWRRTEIDSSDVLPPKFQSTEQTDEFLYRALKYRLEKLVRVLDVWPQALGILALPSNIPSSMAVQAQLVDEVWAQAGDRSTDMTWYAKRLGLAYVYSLTELFMIQDHSNQLIDSWDFLHNRITDLRSLKRMDLKAVSSMLRNGVFALGSVTCNILGLAKKC